MALIFSGILILGVLLVVVGQALSLITKQLEQNVSSQLEPEDPPIDNTEDPSIDDTEDPPIDDTEDPPIDNTEDPPIDDTEDPPIDDTEDPPIDDTLWFDFDTKLKIHLLKPLIIVDGDTRPLTKNSHQLLSYLAGTNEPSRPIGLIKRSYQDIDKNNWDAPPSRNARQAAISKLRGLLKIKDSTHDYIPKATNNEEIYYLNPFDNKL